MGSGNDSGVGRHRGGIHFRQPGVHVVHAAAHTSLAAVREVHRCNVSGTALLLQRVQRAPNLERFLHVSTAYCCGADPDEVVFEDDSPRASHNYINEYTRTKAEAECHLRAASNHFPILIARPSVVIGHTVLGVAPSSSIYWYYRALTAIGAGPFALDTRRDIVPVDYVAEALEYLLFLPQPKHKTYHISAGVSSAVTVESILRCLGMKRAWRVVSPSELENMESEISRLVATKAEARKLCKGLTACARFGAMGVQYFDNQRLLSEGLRAPPAFTDYIHRCVETATQRTIFELMVDD